MRISFALLRVLAAASAVAAVWVNFSDSLAFWQEARFRDVPGLIVNFFSYFTILSVLASAVVLLIGAGLLAGSARRDPAWFGAARASVVGYMVIACGVYNVLLRETAVTGAAQVQQWTNEVMHVAVPLYLVADWIAAPGRPRMPWRSVALQLAFPVLWLAYTVLRGPLVYDQFKHVQGWYPYPFLNPETSSAGYLSVAAYIVAIALAFGCAAAVTAAVSRWPHLGRLPDDATPSPPHDRMNVA